ncbi:MAG: NADH-quinone oxidoreductase subunit C [Deltaproteobacteria bacterium]|nr:NADH-quinone oxidoreductase subunit C [Deltaproteobacteria bacterium]
MAQVILDKLQKKFAHAIIATHNRFGNETAVVHKEDLVPICELLKNDPELQMSMIIDVTCVDWFEDPSRVEKRPDGERARFDVVYHLYSLERGHRVRLKVPTDGDPPHVPSVFSVWKGADWFEREAYDMYGVIFDGHPDLRRILLYPEFIGHPLRKDYPIDRKQPLIENRLRAVNYGKTGVMGDAMVLNNPLVQIGRRRGSEDSPEKKAQHG